MKTDDKVGFCSFLLGIHVSFFICKRNTVAFKINKQQQAHQRFATVSNPIEK